MATLDLVALYSRQKKYFEEAYKTGEHGWPVEEPSPFVIDFLRKVSLPGKHLRVLDLGCGEGRHTFLFAQKGWRTVGVDYQPLALERANKIAKQKNIRPGFSFVLGDLSHLPFRFQSFDALVDFGVLHHVPRRDTPHYLKTVISLLKSNGFFLLSCFSVKFKHFPGEKRKRNWLIHRGHYDRFFKKTDFSKIFGNFFSILDIEEERQGSYSFYNVLLRKRDHA
ncbi:MAG TPA: class I SAM-dependent methyltransferase [Nitrospiria bacterium]